MVHPVVTALVCENCGIEIGWEAVVRDTHLFCCEGCAEGGPCICSYDHVHKMAEGIMLAARVAPERGQDLAAALLALGCSVRLVPFLNQPVLVLVRAKQEFIPGVLEVIWNRGGSEAWPEGWTPAGYPRMKESTNRRDIVLMWNLEPLLL